jgi:hypothetical protein
VTRVDDDISKLFHVYSMQRKSGRPCGHVRATWTSSRLSGTNFSSNFLARLYNRGRRF